MEAIVRPDLVCKTLKTMKRNKAPGRDGFTVEFFLDAWEIVGQDFFRAIAHFFDSSHMHPGINSTSIALIPKVNTPTTMGDFRPISLYSVAYKGIVKIIANHLKMVLPEVIDIVQSVFIKGRSISYNILMAQELFRGYDRGSVCAKCALKMDLHKAFDSIGWDFILQAMTRMNFPIKFIGWIRKCITTIRFSVKVNGGLNGYFRGAKGLRQGDLMSPYLFAISMNVLSCLLTQTPNEFKYHWICNGMKLIHLFYTDDVLLFSHGDKDSILHIMS